MNQPIVTRAAVAPIEHQTRGVLYGLSCANSETRGPRWIVVYTEENSIRVRQLILSHHEEVEPRTLEAHLPPSAIQPQDVEHGALRSIEQRGHQYAIAYQPADTLNHIEVLLLVAADQQEADVPVEDVVEVEVR